MKKLRNKMDGMMIAAGTKMRSFLSKKREGLDGFIVVIIIIAVALILGLIFKDSIKSFMDQFFTKLTNKSNDFFS